tara:strand:- start:929 stop:1219 length:291 start_codon:yes stop_codon:yes gene_type:complete
MSGGSMDYLCYKLDDVSFDLSTPERRAFKKHLELVSKALHDIEWVDSGDYATGDEVEAILACITPQAVLQETIDTATNAMNGLSHWIDEAKKTIKE